MKPTRIIFMGTPHFAVPSLQALLRPNPLWQCVAVVSQPAKAQGRGRRIQHSPVASLGMDHQVPVLTPSRLKDVGCLEDLAAYQPDLIIVAAYGKILPQRLLQLPPLGCVNLHASLLPAYRGASPIAHAILHGESHTGVCLMGMEIGMDTGPVYARSVVPIGLDATCASLTDQLALTAADLLSTHLPALIGQTLQAEPQNHDQATYAPLLRKQDGAIDFTWSAQRIERAIRAYFPWPKARAWLAGHPVALLQAQVVDTPSHTHTPTLAPGTLHTGPQGELWVQCGQGLLHLLRVQPADRSPMDGKAWLAGRSFQIGDRFTPPTPAPPKTPENR